MYGCIEMCQICEVLQSKSNIYCLLFRYTVHIMNHKQEIWKIVVNNGYEPCLHSLQDTGLCFTTSKWICIRAKVGRLSVRMGSKPNQLFFVTYVVLCHNKTRCIACKNLSVINRCVRFFAGKGLSSQPKSLCAPNDA